MPTTIPVAQAYHADFDLHTLGWKAFQDLCAQICEESLQRTVSIYREAQDGGQDAVFILPSSEGKTEGTVQCKFTSKAEQRLKASDITTELTNIESLVAEGRAATYYFITSMGVDAPIAANIRDQLLAKGVREPYVLGREWITSEIKKSARLRALVPRVYGLGDLSMIIDERSASQTRALLTHLRPSLRVYVPTAAHRMAVRTLTDHKLVLLLGSPAVGKSMLAAILSTMAMDLHKLECFKCDGPLNMSVHWNPNEPRRLFWIDDAFGPNQMRDDYVNAWIEFMPKMKAAIEQGNHFILTSRTHIWNEANHKLGTRNHPLLSNRKAVIEVGRLSPEEREQILYNHVKAGQQSNAWKSSVKPHLPSLAEESSLLPEIARRLGNPNYTAGVRSIPSDLTKFVLYPQEFLEDTFRELAADQQAAMTLVFLSRSRLPVNPSSGDECKLVADKYGTSTSAVAQALEQLEGAFLVKREEGGLFYWSFFHPTLADAVSHILSARPDLVELYLRGVKIETLLSEVVCEGAKAVKDAVAIPSHCFDILVDRILETSNENDLNEKIFQFLDRRAPDRIVECILRSDPKFLDRKGSPSRWMDIGNHAEVLLHAKANALGLLPDEIRSSTYESLSYAARYSLDVSFLSNEDILAIFRPLELMNLTINLVAMLEEEIPSKIAILATDADADSDIDSQFSSVEEFVSKLQSITDYDERVADRLCDLQQSIEEAKAEVESRKSTEEIESFFTGTPSSNIRKEAKTRSIFSDIDE